MNDGPTLREYIPNLLRGVEITVLFTVLGGLLMLILSVVFGIAARSDRLWVRGLSRTIVEFFRGTSLLVQLFWLFLALPLLGIRLDPLFAGVLGLGLNYGAYGSEVVRGSLNAVPAAQWEAATALNLSSWQRMRRVVWPQAIALMIPPFNNLLIQLLKSTPLVTLLALTDLFFVGQAFNFATGRDVLTYVVVLPVLYLVLAYTITFGMNLLEVVVNSRLGRARGLRDALTNLRPGAEMKA